MRSCAVIGCGAAGMAATTTLRQNGLLVTCFEIAPAPGGIWQSNSRDLFSSRGLISPIYPTMRCVLPKDLMAFSDVRFDYAIPHFPHHSSVREYLNQWAEKKGIYGMTRFNTKVESVRFDDRDSLWKLITVNIKNGDVLEYSFDNVCVCTGQTQEAYYPVGLKELLSDYTQSGGELRHAFQIKDFRSLKNKRVVVLGDNVTAYDYCVELKRFGAEVYHSTLLKRDNRGEEHDVGTSLKPYDAFQCQAMGSATMTSPPPAQSFWGQFVKQRKTEVRPLRKGQSIRDMTTLFTLLLQRVPGWREDVHSASELLEKWMRYRNERIEAIPRLGYPLETEGRGIRFALDPTRRPKHAEMLDEAAMHRLGRGSRTASVEDGIFIDDIDVIISVTGYRQRYPFLHPELRRQLEVDTSCLLPAPNLGAGKTTPAALENKRGLYLGTVCAAQPSLAFMGTQKELLPPFMMFEIQAKFVAFAFSQRLKLPGTLAEMMAKEADLLRDNPALRNLYNSHGLGLNSATYFNVLQAQLGVGSKETYTSKVFDRYRWFLMSSTVHLYHKFRSMAPLKRKKQHVLFSNEV